MALQLCLVLLASSIVHAESPREVVMEKPTFEAVYYEGSSFLDMKIHEPRNVIGEFGGYVVLMKSDDLEEDEDWIIVNTLTPRERECTIHDIESSTQYAITVQGLVLPNKRSENGDRVEFTVFNREESIPQNVRLEVVDSHTVKATWDPPAQHNGRITGYTIRWTADKKAQREITVSADTFYVFTNLKPEQTVSVTVRANSRPDSPNKLDYFGSFSDHETATTPPSNGGKLLPLTLFCAVP
ncbi:hypothetical protein TcWFU_009524 [Taenia crassiceps]|uniref:Fibronectin type-III domain-containing protein n=1 Tax=Taenia crassiceps TaxID=6207 RepID=A0ABR4Q0B6_9CEST